MTKEMIMRIVGAALGVIVGVLIMKIGFWWTLLFVALAVVGWCLAGNQALHENIKKTVDRFRSVDQ